MIVLYILLALLVLLMMVTIHEFGHYVAGKMLGFKINEFSIGFGPSLFSKKCKSGEIFSIRLVPLGGYCAFEGEEDNSDNSGAFTKQKPWKRLIVLFNGAFFNFISAIIFSFIMLVSVGYDVPQVYSVNDVVRIDSVYVVNSVGGYTTVPFEFTDKDIIMQVNGDDIKNSNNSIGVTKDYLASVLSQKESINDEYTLTVKRKTDNDNEETFYPMVKVTKHSNAGTTDDKLQKNDVIYKINGVAIDFIKDNTFNSLITDGSSESTVTLTVKRNGEIKDLVLNYYDTGFKDADGNYAKAIGVSSTAYRFSFGESLVRCVPYTFGFSWKVLQALGQLIVGKGLTQVGGPIYTIGTIASLSSQSLSYFLVLLPLIAANLAVFNWLPIPALDGSKMLLTTIEWIKGKPLFSQKTENLIHNIGFFVLLGLVFAADIYQIIAKIFGFWF